MSGPTSRKEEDAGSLGRKDIDERLRFTNSELASICDMKQQKHENCRMNVGTHQQTAYHELPVCLYLANKLPHFFSKSLNFGRFAKATQSHGWDKSQLKESNAITPMCQMFSKFLDHRVHACFLKCSGFYSLFIYLANLKADLDL